MEPRQEDNDGSDIFWPGYVDAVTNLVLNLLFLLTIMTVAVFMFALELGRASHSGPGQPPVVSTKQDVAAVSKATTDHDKENIALKREIERLNMKLAQRIASPVPAGQPDKTEQSAKTGHPGKTAQTGKDGQLKSEPSVQSEQPVQLGGLVETVEVTSNVAKPLNGLDEARASDAEIIVRFADEAVDFTPAEHEQLLDSLKPIAAKGKATIHVEVPAGFSEAKRMGFYRAMAVRNLLIAMKMPKDEINVLVLEGKNNPNASLVRVR
jgi:hypothetical protein